MGITTLGVVFVIALLSCLVVVSYFTRKVIEAPLKEGRARGSAVTEFVDDLQKHRWPVIVVLALLVALDQSYRFSGGLLQSRLLIAAVITAFFIARLLLRRRAS